MWIAFGTFNLWGLNNADSYQLARCRKRNHIGKDAQGCTFFTSLSWCEIRGRLSWGLFGQRQKRWSKGEESFGRQISWRYPSPRWNARQRTCQSMWVSLITRSVTQLSALLLLELSSRVEDLYPTRHRVGLFLLILKKSRTESAAQLGLLR